MPATPAGALVRTAVTIDGPSSAIVSLGGVAMAPDGTGGVVYLKLYQGEPHVFVSRFVHGAWQPPQQVDTGLPFDSSWPVIGAGDRGLLVVVWAQSYAQDINGIPFRRLYSATLKPGAQSFGPQISLDANLRFPNATGDQAVSELFPSLAMNPGGQAYLAYRVVTDSCTIGCGNASLGTFYRPGDSFASFRVARFNGETWSVLGDVNRNPAFSVRPGNAGNSPQVVIDAKGHGLVAFQEPDNTGYDRIWARRLFGSGISQIFPVSAQTVGGQPVNGDVDAFSLGGGTAGAGAVAYRQLSAPGSVFGTTRMLETSIATPSNVVGGNYVGANVFSPAVTIDSGLGGLGVPAIAMTEPAPFTSAFAGAGSLQSASGDPTGATGPVAPTPLALGPVSGTAQPGVSAGDDGSIVTSWPSADAAGRPLVMIDENVQQNVNGLPVFQDARAQVAAAVGGPIVDVVQSGAGSGNALVAFQQGQAGSAQIAATVVEAPPGPFTVFPPPSWVHPRGALITWTRAVDDLSPVTYTVLLDGAVRARGLHKLSFQFNRRGLTTGQYNVVVVATDALGQRRLSPVTNLEIDTKAPRVSLSHHGRHVAVRVNDGPLDQNSGVDPTTTTVHWGDGSPAGSFQSVWIPTAYSLATHDYRSAGRFTITVHAQDAARNVRVVRYHITVP